MFATDTTVALGHTAEGLDDDFRQNLLLVGDVSGAAGFGGVESRLLAISSVASTMGGPQLPAALP